MKVRPQHGDTPCRRWNGASSTLFVCLENGGTPPASTSIAHVSRRRHAACLLFFVRRRCVLRSRSCPWRPWLPGKGQSSCSDTVCTSWARTELPCWSCTAWTASHQAYTLRSVRCQAAKDVGSSRHRRLLGAACWVLCESKDVQWLNFGSAVGVDALVLVLYGPFEGDRDILVHSLVLCWREGSRNLLATQRGRIKF